MKTSISLAELSLLLNNKNHLMIIDVRSKPEFSEKHIAFAGNIPIESIEAGNFTPEPNKIIITVCGKGGGRSKRAAKYLRENTGNEVYFLEGGTFGWFEN